MNFLGPKILSISNWILNFISDLKSALIREKIEIEEQTSTVKYGENMVVWDSVVHHHDPPRS